MMVCAVIRCPDNGSLENVFILDLVRAPANHYIKNEALVIYKSPDGFSICSAPRWIDFDSVIAVEPDEGVQSFIQKKFASSRRVCNEY